MPQATFKLVEQLTGTGQLLHEETVLRDVRYTIARYQGMFEGNGLPIPGLLAPGCGLSLVPGSFLVYETVINPTGTFSAAPLAIPAAWHGLTFYAQYAACDAALANISMSNGLKLTAGLN